MGRGIQQWVSCYKPMGKFKMPRGKKCPQSRRKNAAHEVKVMFITAIARNSIKTGHNGAIRIDPVGHYRPAKTGNKKLGLLKGRKLFVPDSAKAELYAKILGKKSYLRSARGGRLLRLWCCKWTMHRPMLVP